MTGQHHPRADSSDGTGIIPASSIVTLSDESMFLFKEGQQTIKHHTSVKSLYAAVLSGSDDEINAVINQSQNNTPQYEAFDAKSYTGRLLAPVQAFWAQHPKPTQPPPHHR